jgi:hypothetical protein
MTTHSEQSFDDVLVELRAKHTGDLLLSRYENIHATALEPDLTIDRADPYITIDHRNLRDMGDWVDMVGADRAACIVDGDLVKIRARNDTVVYRLVGFDSTTGMHFAEWV